MLGYMRSLIETLRGRSTPIEPLDIDFSKYDFILLGTPVWAG